MFLGDEGDGKAACGAWSFGSVPNETMRFLVENEVKELSLPKYDPNRGRLHHQELYALIQVIFTVNNIEKYLHKKYDLSIG